MIDSVLKGTGNSRFLKSAVPAGTSWADALAMLQAGTFPIDFNGINTEGFQQVGTPLNKANLLKDATAAQIGLPPSTTPDGMFQALGNTGELHVWRKTVVNGSPIAATFKLEDYTVDRSDCGGNNVPNALLFMGYGSGYIDVASSITVNDSGGVSLNNSTRYTAGGGETNLPNIILGKYIKIYFSANGPVNLDQSLTYFVPSSSSTGWSGSNWIYSTKLQKVVGVPYQPAGTTTTYPVSTNPKAYQEGDDAKAAGYVLGDTVTGSFCIGNITAGTGAAYYVASEILVSDDGVPSIPTTTLLTVGSQITSASQQSLIAGKFMQIYTTGSMFSVLSGPFTTAPGPIVYIPNDVKLTAGGGNNWNLYIDRYQPVTGYAAIPAGTTIEYLGRLGDKARVQMVSYVGTGTYGSSNPNSLTFDFVPKMVIIRCNENSSNKFDWIIGMTDVEVHWDGDYHCFVSIAGKTLSFYSFNNSYYQMNESGKKYYAIAIG